MSRAQVAKILDPLHPLEAADILTDGTLTEFRGMHLPVCNFENDQLRCIDTHWLMAPMLLDGEDVFVLPSLRLLRKLEVSNNGALILYSMIYFVNIGLTACNYVDKKGRILQARNEDDDERGVGVFRKGTFDNVLENAESISFVNA